MISLSLKGLASFLEPTGFIWLVLSVLIGVKIHRKQWRLIWLPVVAWLLLSLTACTPLSQSLLASLESQWPPVDVAQLPECDAIVVLGGGVEPSESEPAGIHLKGASDRLFAALALAKKGRGRLILIGGGSFQRETGVDVFEGEGAKRWVEEWQLSPVPLQSLGPCRDTHDEAVRVAALVAQHGWKRVALVTSAYHMTRSKAVFEKAGTVVVPVPCNYLSAYMQQRHVKWLDVPKSGNLAHFEAWMHEIIGWWAYRLCGWV